MEELEMKNNNQKKLQVILRLIIGVILYGILGWVYFIGIASPNFDYPFIVVYRGLGCGMAYPLYFFLIPTYTNKVFPDIRYSGAIVSAVSFIITVILLFAIFPLHT